MTNFFKHFSMLVPAILFWGCVQKPSTIEIIVTTDVHGQIISLNPIDSLPKRGSLSKVAYLADSLRKQSPTLLLDNGDLLQGSPEIYYLNYVVKEKTHPMTEIMRSIGYNAMVVGNHDMECGPEIYRRLKSELGIPYLAANIIEKSTGKSFFAPYHVFRIAAKKIAVLGLTTPGVPNWLPEKLWEGLKFVDMVESADYWIKIVRQTEKPDWIIGLFHAGWDASFGNADPLAPMNENASLRVAREVDGFDLVFIGHDHQTKVFDIVSNHGRRVVVVDCGSHARTVGRATLKTSRRGITLDTAWVQSMEDIPPLSTFDAQNQNWFQQISAWTNAPITTIDGEINTADAVMKPSSYLNLIHAVQLRYTDADISLATPFTYRKKISGQLTLADIFAIYPFENQLYCVNLTGKEIKQVLEKSYSRWFHGSFPEKGLLRYQADGDAVVWETPLFSFVTAGGMEYTIDYRQGYPPKCTDAKLVNGRLLIDTHFYKVVVNSYIASGGGGHLTTDIGLSAEELKNRATIHSEKEFRWLLAEYLQTQAFYQPDTLQNWKIEPLDSWNYWIKKEKARFSPEQ